MSMLRKRASRSKPPARMSVFDWLAVSLAFLIVLTIVLQPPRWRPLEGAISGLASAEPELDR